MDKKVKDNQKNSNVEFADEMNADKKNKSQK